jgi:hypothetical protein
MFDSSQWEIKSLKQPRFAAVIDDLTKIFADYTGKTIFLSFFDKIILQRRTLAN